MTGRVRCPFPPPYSAYCPYIAGIPGDRTAYPNYLRNGAINIAGSDGPYGGAFSTRHTLTGRAPAIGWQPGRGSIGLGDDFRVNDYGGVYLIGREILREAEGHEPKITPEPGTMLLLGAGMAGLALVGGATRRSRQR